MRRSTTAAVIFSAIMVIGALPDEGQASPDGVGLGVAAGANMATQEEIDDNTSFAWGFFVDIPLLETFYISPAAMLYELDTGVGNRPVTDIDLNFKFIVPVGPLSVGAGLLAGLTAGLDDYRGHYGLLGYGAFNLVSNLDAFVMLQYKHLAVEGSDVENYYGYAGGMFRF